MQKLILALAGVLALSGCRGSASSTQDVAKLLTVANVKTGWFDAGIENGRNKLVPTISLLLKNVSDQTVTQVQLNAVIRRVGEADEWGGAYTRAIGSEGLPPGGYTRAIVLKSNLGYTGTEPRNVMLQNSHFVDAHIELFAKYGGGNWTKLGDFPVARELLTR